jgi:hypothetical protein
MTASKRKGFSTEAMMKGAIKASAISHANRIEAKDFAAVAVDRGRDDEIFAGFSFADDPRASAWEPRWTKLPEPTHSECGCAAAMVLASRVR